MDRSSEEPGRVSDYVRSTDFEVYLRYEDDVAPAYRAYYQDQLVKDRRSELGRFLFGVSFTTLGFIISMLKLTNSGFGMTDPSAGWLFTASGVLLVSSLCALRLAVPKTQPVDPTTIELVELHRANSIEQFRLAYVWFALWLVGLSFGVGVLLQ